MRRRSVWESYTIASSAFPEFKEKKSEADLVIIGGGITGLTTAYLLKDENKTIVLLEAHSIGEGTTGLSSCHLTTDIDEEYRNITENFDDKTASVVAESRVAAIDFIEKIVSDNSIQCDFKRVPGYLYTEIPEEVTQIKEEHAYAAKAGLNVQLVNSAPLPYVTKKALRFENQARFNSWQYLKGLANLIKDRVSIYENSPVTDVKKDRDYFIVKTPNGSIRARQVVMATQLPLFFNVLQTVAAPYISYMLAARIENAEYADALFWDMADPYHYIRYYQKEEGTYVVVGGADHKTGSEKNTEVRFHQLEKFVRDRFQISSIDYKWSAQYYEPADGLPYIGRSPFEENILVATGFSGDGLVYGTIAGIVLADLILEKENSWHKVFDSRRFTPAVSAADFIKENTDVAQHFIKDRFKAHEEEFEKLKPGEGMVTRVDGKPVAVMRNENNELKGVSAVCTHLKCFVNWNSFEQTWDCPCHGSRFDTDGKVVYGPATKKLSGKRIMEKEKIDKGQNKE